MLLSVAVLVVRRLILLTITGINNLELGAVVLGTVLSHRHCNRLVVPSRDYSADTVDTSGQTICKFGPEKTPAVAGVVDALEECEGYWIGRCSRGHAAHALDCNMAMANDVAVSIEVLGCSVVVDRWIGKESGAEVLCLNLNVERRVRGYFHADLGVGDHGRDHVGLGGDFAHRNAITGPGHDLLAIGDFLALAEVDEVRVIAGWKLAERQLLERQESLHSGRCLTGFDTLSSSFLASQATGGLNQIFVQAGLATLLTSALSSDEADVFRGI